LLDLSYEVTAEGENDVDIHHFDLYRLQKGADLAALDIDGALERSICLIEWPDRLREVMLPKQRLDLDIRIVGDNDARSVTLTPHGRRWSAMLDACMSEFKGGAPRLY